MAVTTTQVQQLYLAYFGRPAEQAGLTYWTSQANANLTDVSAAFAQQQEYTTVYGGLTRSQTIETLYQNLFNRSAAGNELNYWLNSTDVSISNLALALTNGATGTDRLVLDTKAQYAATVTANAGTAAAASAVANTYQAAATTATTVNGTSYANLAAYLAANPSNNAAAFYSVANTAAKAAVSPTLVDATGTLNANFQGLTAGTVNLSSLSGAQTVTLPTNGSLVTDLTFKGTVDGAASIVLNEQAATDIVTALHLNVSSNAATATDGVLTVAAAQASALTSVDGASSSAGLVVEGALASGTGAGAVAAAALQSDVLTSITTGSGADTILANTSANKAVTLTIDAGAGNDVITSTVVKGALVLNGGAGNDVITVTTSGQAAATVNAGAGNDVVNLSATATSGITAAHVTSITLGDGNDTLNVTSLANLNGTFTTGSATQITAANTAIAEDLVKVTDFSGSQDKMVVTVGSASLVTLDNTQLGTVQGAATLAEAVASAANIIAGTTPAAHSTSFVYGGNTYVFVDAGSGNLGTVGNGDGLIELTGYTGGLTAANFATA